MRTQRDGGRPRLLVAAMVVDTLGGGLFAPFELIYASWIIGLDLASAGLVIGSATGLALLAGPPAGAATDRYGPTAVVVLSNLLGVGGCIALLRAEGAWGLGVAAALLAAAARVFWAAFAPLVMQVADASHWETWFARLRGARYAGLGVGQALSGAFLLGGISTGLRWLLAANALSYLVALVLILAARGSALRPDTGRKTSVSGSYGNALHDTSNVALAGMNVLATLLIISPALTVPVFVLRDLKMATWWPGVLGATTTAVIAAGIWFSPRVVAGRRRLDSLSSAALVWAAAFSCFALITIQDRSPALLAVAAMALLGVGEALYAPVADALPLALAPPGAEGRYSALHQFAWGVSETVAAPLCGLLLSTGAEVTWVVFVGLSLSSAVGYRLLHRLVDARDGVSGRR